MRKLFLFCFLGAPSMACASDMSPLTLFYSLPIVLIGILLGLRISLTTPNRNRMKLIIGLQIPGWLSMAYMIDVGFNGNSLLDTLVMVGLHIILFFFSMVPIVVYLRRLKHRAK